MYKIGWKKWKVFDRRLIDPSPSRKEFLFADLNDFLIQRKFDLNVIEKLLFYKEVAVGILKSLFWPRKMYRLLKLYSWKISTSWIYQLLRVFTSSTSKNSTFNSLSSHSRGWGIPHLQLLIVTAKLWCIEERENFLCCYGIQRKLC